MSGHGFHVHGPHDHELEHAQQGGHGGEHGEHGGMINQIAMFTAIKRAEAEATQWDKQSDQQMHQHHRWAQSTTVLQVCIALAAIALLTKKKWLEYAMFGAGALGVLVGALAALHI